MADLSESFVINKTVCSTPSSSAQEMVSLGQGLEIRTVRFSTMTDPSKGRARRIHRHTVLTEWRPSLSCYGEPLSRFGVLESWWFHFQGREECCSLKVGQRPSQL